MTALPLFLIGVMSLLASLGYDDGASAMQMVRHFRGRGRQACLPEIFTWISKRIEATIQLSIHISYPDWDRQNPGCTPDDLLERLCSSGHELNANMKTIEQLTAEDDAGAVQLGWLQDWVIAQCSRLGTVSLPLEKAPAWLMCSPTLQHICLYFPPDQTAQGLFAELSGLDGKNLPNLRTLYLKGSSEPLELECVTFQDSERLEAVHISDCWVDDLSLPPSCKLSVSAQSSFLMVRMAENEEHPLVRRANYVCLPTDLADSSIPEVFSSMHSLRLTRPHDAYRPSSESDWRGNSDHMRCFMWGYTGEPCPYYAMGVHVLTCLAPQWQHGNLRELLIEGNCLKIVIPLFPCLKVLLVSCKNHVAVEFMDPAGLGRTITRLSISGKKIRCKMQQQQVLCKALRARKLRLGGDWSRHVTIHALGHQSYAVAADIGCACKACPPCLGNDLEAPQPNDLLLRLSEW